MIETGRSTKSRARFFNDAPRIWNKAPTAITKAKSLNIARKKSRNFVNATNLICHIPLIG